VCPNCGRRTPLVGNWWLARVKGKEGYERLAFFRPFKAEGEVKIEVVDLGKDVRAEVDARAGIIRIAGKEYRVLGTECCREKPDCTMPDVRDAHKG